MSSLTRRNILLGSAVAGAAAIAARRTVAQQPEHAGAVHGEHAGHAEPAQQRSHAGHGRPAQQAEHADHAHGPAGAPPRVQRGPRPKPPGFVDSGRVITPGGTRLPWKVVGGVKVFHLIAEPIEHEPVPGMKLEAWGYNGQTPGPTIEVTEGDRCRFYVTNRLAEPTSVHWHGVLVPNGMDGVAGLTQRAVAPGETYVYEFVMPKAGTFMYHPHSDEMVQIALGMQGMIVVHPRAAGPKSGVRDYALMLNEWKVDAGAARPDPMAMTDFNMLTINGKSFPAVEPLLAQRGDLVRIRMGNLSPMDHHPLHIHGHAFEIVETDGGRVPRSARVPETTVIVPVGAVRVIEFRANALGDWPFHCHMTHHVMNQMGHESKPLVGADLRAADRKIRQLVPGYMTMGTTGMSGMGEMSMPVPDNSVPMKGMPGPFGFIDMGGMFTLLKVRDGLPPGNVDPGWYQHPKDTVASLATEAQLERDGIDLDLEPRMP